jgi:uncharacterized membrane protein
MSYRKHPNPYRPWIVPLTYASFALAVGFILPRAERYFGMIASPINSAAAIGIYSAVASGMITLTAVVFSLTFLIVQFSSTAYSPRLVLWMARDPFLSHALGVFVGTFIYALTALAWIDRNDSTSVPFVTFLCAVGWLLASVGMFIALVQRVGALQIGVTLQFINQTGRKVIAEMYPKPWRKAAVSEHVDFGNRAPDQVLMYSAAPQAIQSIDIAQLVNFAENSSGNIQLLVSVGDSVSKSTPLLAIYNSLLPVDIHQLENAFTLGNERTFEQDPKYAIRLLVDIAIKALSPAINDPTTAVQALDQIEDLLVNLGERDLDYGEFRDERGVVRVVMPYATWEDFLRLAIDEILMYGATSVQVMRRMKAVTSKLLLSLPTERRDAIEYWRKRMAQTISQAFADPELRLDASVEDRQGLGVACKTNGDRISVQITS